MPKEIANKTKGETYYKCTHCGDEIYWNTHKKMIMCKCGALGVDGCEFYVRLIGDEADREEIKKVRKL
ncbi:hypothetical protein A3B21_00470 [Candidatus Uhrbacteria bacterium RIFCSPLOWO2_01_FULL_47_24]|uniref:DUF7695 domain-containing protein n=1 Tax=Candidatus Uhrbacteria bacterium RIFCSPLOWO2_01_FULL_47_24 TaxID=1802401 RepID=A0A1F7USW5_9BACT|nr:MAG: hypothetical protein A2753_05405 [Candidatus Uhrbacteria bacterium RIFCSPHIGHO2_01_FULL_47_11]OGL67812.1 MAG: hypothetical protein A3D58_00180 [Candidatus Uhrbacteria bacterium RIFCSPHIGHO2_02_FULL_46_47]OGL76345.1 MAG: hypothetical protein A3F52_01165 [Candidatus Uhrbacteria bacterium RIFCSPHIGHO2_12_FULL_47_11]OGL81382.1 MAG: hypothetical protein A3B21_00470 [Candidatus Uhrbacteria bacterium RIFCSPLOWO2_01_FULL_47_24]OGL83816.1 MAG: hypothetical protein A3J03_02830 [Candidatus Uhrbact